MDTVRAPSRRLGWRSVTVLAVVMLASTSLVAASLTGRTAGRAAGVSIRVCSPSSLQVSVIFNGPGNPYGAIVINRPTATTPCSLAGRPLVRVVTKSGAFLKLHESTDRLRPALPRPTSPVIMTAKVPWAVVEMKWCGFTNNYSHVDITFRGWKKPLSEKNPPYSKTSFAPPPCNHGPKRLLSVDYVRAMDGGTIAGSTPRVRVTPSSDLHNGEKVRVYVTGLGLGAKFWISECANRYDANGDGCGEQLAAQPFGLSNMYGAGSYTFVVRDSASNAPYYAGAFHECSSQCVLVAAGGDRVFADAPITFGGPSG